MSVPHLIALDIDGTTIDHDGHLSDAVREAVQAVVEAGHHVVIATGRTIVGSQRCSALDLNAADTRLRCCQCVRPSIASIV